VSLHTIPLLIFRPIGTQGHADNPQSLNVSLPSPQETGTGTGNGGTGTGAGNCGHFKPKRDAKTDLLYLIQLVTMWKVEVWIDSGFNLPARIEISLAQSGKAGTLKQVRAILVTRPIWRSNDSAIPETVKRTLPSPDQCSFLP
jgi:hypothetical protein